MSDPIRGEVWLAELGTGDGHEQSGRRPVLVLSVDAFNSGPSRLVIVVPFTSKIAKSRTIRSHVPVSPPEAGLKAPSVILCDQIRTISRNRLVVGPWGNVTSPTLSAVEKAVRMLLSL